MWSVSTCHPQAAVQCERSPLKTRDKTPGNCAASTDKIYIRKDIRSPLAATPTFVTGSVLAGGKQCTAFNLLWCHIYRSMLLGPYSESNFYFCDVDNIYFLQMGIVFTLMNVQVPSTTGRKNNNSLLRKLCPVCIWSDILKGGINYNGYRTFSLHFCQVTWRVR